MFLHLGKDLIIPINELIAIIDVESVKSADTKNFFKIAEEEGFIYDISDNNVKSYIITEKIENNKEKTAKVRKSVIYSSNISSKTLLKRAGFADNIE